MIYLDNNVLGSLLAEDGCKISIILCWLFLWPSFNMIEYLVGACRHLMAFISPQCPSLSLAVVRILRKGTLTLWSLGMPWWLCGSPTLHELTDEGTATLGLVRMALCVE